MGYILPVNNYQYEQYVRQDISRKINPVKSEKVYAPAAVTNTYESTEQQYTAHKDASKRRMEEAEKLIANLTGKGRKFNELV